MSTPRFPQFCERVVESSKRAASCSLRESVAIAVVVATLAGCAMPQRPPPVDPDAVRAEIERLLPPKTETRSGWATDIFAAFESLDLAPTTEHICAVMAVAEQESNLVADPV